MNLFEYLKVSEGLVDSGGHQEADCIICLAFGRNDIEDNDLGLLGFMAERLDDPKMIEIINNSFFDPGLPNIKLAERVQELMLKHSFPALLQWEVAVALDRDFYENHKDQVFIIWPPKACKKGFNSKEVLEKAIEIMDLKDFNIPILLAHKLHIKRVVALWEAMVEEKPVVVNSFVELFDEGSVQDRTRDRKTWRRKEFLVRIHHWIFGWV